MPHEERHVRREVRRRGPREVGSHRERRAAVIPVHHRGDPLQQVPLGGRQVEESLPRMRVRVDEARRDHQAGGIHSALVAAAPASAPTRTMRPPTIPTSAVDHGAPLPSTMRPPVMITS